MKRRGFTIVELLIVIVIIAVLAAITIVAYNGFQQRSRVTALWTGIAQVNKSFRLYLTDTNASSWPLDTVIDPSVPGGNPTIVQLVAHTNFKNFMQQPPSQGTNWFYDNDNDTYPAGGMTGGVNICLDGIDSTLALAIDQAKDDGDINTGALRYNGSRLYYSLSTTQAFNG
jgi:prepilin-type N-terminal cleavage/methylation domain-containing protein